MFVAEWEFELALHRARFTYAEKKKKIGRNTWMMTTPCSMN